MNVDFKEDSLSQLLEWGKTDKKVFTKLSKLLIEVQRTPYFGTGHPEPLVGDLSGKWSRPYHRKGSSCL
jgi:toxin YoeB